MEWEPISDRLIRARFASNYCNVTILQCYATTNEAEEDVKDDFYEQLHHEVSKIPQHDMLLIAGDLNAKGGRMQWGGTAAEPSTIMERGLLNFVLATGA